MSLGWWRLWAREPRIHTVCSEQRYTVIHSVLFMEPQTYHTVAHVPTRSRARLTLLRHVLASLGGGGPGLHSAYRCDASGLFGQGGKPCNQRPGGEHATQLPPPPVDALVRHLGDRWLPLDDLRPTY